MDSQIEIEAYNGILTKAKENYSAMGTNSSLVECHPLYVGTLVTQILYLENTYFHSDRTSVFVAIGISEEEYTFWDKKVSERVALEQEQAAAEQETTSNCFT